MYAAIDRVQDAAVDRRRRRHPGLAEADGSPTIFFVPIAVRGTRCCARFGSSQGLPAHDLGQGRAGRVEGACRCSGRRRVEVVPGHRSIRFGAFRPPPPRRRPCRVETIGRTARGSRSVSRLRDGRVDLAKSTRDRRSCRGLADRRFCDLRPEHVKRRPAGERLDVGMTAARCRGSGRCPRVPEEDGVASWRPWTARPRLAARVGGRRGGGAPSAQATSSRRRRA